MTYSNWKVIDLKAKLRELGLAVSGNKEQLIKRLQEANRAEQEQYDKLTIRQLQVELAKYNLPTTYKRKEDLLQRLKTYMESEVVTASESDHPSSREPTPSRPKKQVAPVSKTPRRPKRKSQEEEGVEEVPAKKTKLNAAQTTSARSSVSNTPKRKKKNSGAKKSNVDAAEEVITASPSQRTEEDVPAKITKAVEPNSASPSDVQKQKEVAAKKSKSNAETVSASPSLPNTSWWITLPTSDSHEKFIQEHLPNAMAPEFLFASNGVDVGDVDLTVLSRMNQYIPPDSPSDVIAKSFEVDEDPENYNEEDSEDGYETSRIINVHPESPETETEEDDEDWEEDEHGSSLVNNYRTPPRRQQPPPAAQSRWSCSLI